MDQGSIQRRQASRFKGTSPLSRGEQERNLLGACGQRPHNRARVSTVRWIPFNHNFAVSVPLLKVIHTRRVLFYVFYKVFPPKFVL